MPGYIEGRPESDDSMRRMAEENVQLNRKLDTSILYIRQKVNQLLSVMGTLPLDPSELDDDTLLELDPIGIVSDSFRQILQHHSKTNEDLQMARNEIQAIFDSAGIGILVVDTEMKVQAFNSKLKEVFLAGECCAQGRKCKDVICGQDDSGDNCIFRMVMAAGGSARSMNWRWQDRIFDVVGTPLRDKSGEITQVILVYLDITERKLAEESLTMEKERLAVTLRSIGDGVITTDTSARVVLINKAAESMTGFRQEEAAGRHIDEIFLISNRKTMERIPSPVERVLNTGWPAALPKDVALVDREGFSRIIADSCAPIRDSESRVVGTVLVFQDITEKSRLEEEHLRVLKVESVGIFAGGLAHDFNNLLTSILGNISFAKSLIAPGDKAYKRLEAAEQSSVKAKELTARLLTFAKGSETSKRVMNIRGLIRESAASVLNLLHRDCSEDIAVDLRPVNVDEQQIHHALHNLVRNACEAVQERGTIRISARNSIVTPEDHLPLKEGAYVLITIEDKGVGIPEENLQRIFDPYFTTKEMDSKKGTGLALAVTYSIIHSHGGHITVASRVGIGTTVMVYLPAAETVDMSGKTIRTRPPKVLLMDDEEIVREAAGDMLRHLGCEVVTAADGAEMLSLYEEASDRGIPFDAIIMDLGIPSGLDGKQAMQELLQIDPDVKAIVSSGFLNSPVMADYRSHGFSGMIRKPYKMRELDALLREQGII